TRRAPEPRLWFVGTSSGPPPPTRSSYVSSSPPRPTRPFFSVVIPTRDRDDFLRVALESVRGQTERDFEVIVVDDAGSASTRTLAASFDDIGVTYVVNDHAHGGAGTRNAGAERARGSWIAFLDDD